MLTEPQCATFISRDLCVGVLAFRPLRISFRHTFHGETQSHRLPEQVQGFAITTINTVPQSIISRQPVLTRIAIRIHLLLLNPKP